MQRFIQKHAAAIKWTSVAVMLLAVLLFMRTLPLGQLQQGFKQWISGLGPSGAVVFGLVYVVATVCLIPGSLVTLAGGAVFGLWVGFLAVSISSVTGAALAFLIARYLARKKVERMARSNPKFGAVDEAISEGGWKIVALMRLSPAIPFNVQNYLYGLTDIRFTPYVLASWIAMAPGTFMYVYLGHVAGTAATGGNEGKSLGEWVLLGIGLLATIVVTVYITRLAKQKLNEKTQVKEQTSQHEEVTEEEHQPRGSLGYAAIALVMLVSAVALQWKSDAIASLIKTVIPLGPPQVSITEKYEPKPDGPTFDHGVFDEVLAEHVREGGWVDYAALKRDSANLDAYLSEIAEAPFDDLGRDEKLALLINAYNAFTLKLISENYPLQSIKDIPSAKRWEDRRWRVGSHTWSLSQIEHEQIRPNFAEPRIHFALVCAAVGCPPLVSEAYQAARLDEQLERQATYAHDHETWFQMSKDGSTVKLTRLFDWYGGDFRQAAGSVLKYVTRYSTAVAKALEQGDSPQVEFLPYDWSLNSVENQVPR